METYLIFGLEQVLVSIGESERDEDNKHVTMATTLPPGWARDGLTLV